MAVCLARYLVARTSEQRAGGPRVASLGVVQLFHLSLRQRRGFLGGPIARESDGFTLRETWLSQ